MRTKKVKLYVDLPEGWQDTADYFITANSTPYGTPIGRDKRFAIEVELPVFGGSAAAENTLTSTTKEVKVGLQGEDE